MSEEPTEAKMALIRLSPLREALRKPVDEGTSLGFLSMMKENDNADGSAKNGTERCFSLRRK